MPACALSTRWPLRVGALLFRLLFSALWPGELRRMIRSLLISAHKLSDEDDSVTRKRI